MNSMKRILALIVTFMMVFSLAAPVGYALDETENELETSDMQEEPVLQDEGPLEEPVPKETENELETSDMQEEPVLQDEGPLEEPVLQDEGPLEEPVLQDEGPLEEPVLQDEGP
ncbi:MAG: hypothetical protein IIU36_04405, partial [Firmicutes bacterium]|nr:hypothetical protein [Bacillota bacterium]